MTQKKDHTGMQGADFYRLDVARLREKVVPYGHLRSKVNVLVSPLIEGFGLVPIVEDQRRLVGIISEFDVLASLERGGKWSELLAQDVMTPNRVTVTEDTDVHTIEVIA